jgi:hypothetical protein
MLSLIWNRLPYRHYLFIWQVWGQSSEMEVTDKTASLKAIMPVKTFANDN